MSFTFEAGAFIRKSVRNYLEAKKFTGAKIDWIEQKSLISSIFVIKGEDCDLVMSELLKWQEGRA